MTTETTTESLRTMAGTKIKTTTGTGRDSRSLASKGNAQRDPKAASHAVKRDTRRLIAPRSQQLKRLSKSKLIKSLNRLLKKKCNLH